MDTLDNQDNNLGEENTLGNSPDNRGETVVSPRGDPQSMVGDTVGDTEAISGSTVVLVTETRDSNPTNPTTIITPEYK